jgi:hypothetical protein
MESRMQNFKFSLVLALAAVFAWPATVNAQSTSKLECKAGPITRTYGGSDWQLYSCNDGLSLAFKPAEGNPAAPAYFVITPQDDGHYHLVGKGKGDAMATNDAVKDIQALSKENVAQLIAATRPGKQ